MTPTLVHSFPRRFAPSRCTDRQMRHEAGLRVLALIVEHGLLLTPEHWRLDERWTDGDVRSIDVWQHRFCLTELTPGEVPSHLAEFGEFAIEFPIVGARALGALPVTYVPPHSTTSDDMSGVGETLAARLADVQDLLRRLAQLEAVAAGSPDPTAMLNVTKNGVVAGATQVTAAAGLELTRFLQAELRPAAELEGAIKALAGTFYRTEDPARHSSAEALHYYRQREWRILANTVAFGRAVDVGLPADLASALLVHDSEFFSRTLPFPGGPKRVVDCCSLLPRVAGRHALAFASRIIVPAEVAASAIALVRRVPGLLDLRVDPSAAMPITGEP